MSFISQPGVDEVGWQLLQLLQQDGRMSHRELGRRVGLTAPAVAERVKRLEAAGVITGYHAHVDYERLGFGLTAVVRLAPRDRGSDGALRTVAASSEILECHRITGEDCYIMKIIAPSMRHLEKLLDRLMEHGDTTTSMVISSPVVHRVIGPDTLVPPSEARKPTR
ncbi:MAG: Lrp/AsnC family transcriptional regulator [Chloroflexota bacterium]